MSRAKMLYLDFLGSWFIQSFIHSANTNPGTGIKVSVLPACRFSN